MLLLLHVTRINGRKSARPCGKVLYEAMQNSIIKRVKRIFIVQALGVVINARSLFKLNELRPADLLTLTTSPLEPLSLFKTSLQTP